MNKVFLIGNLTRDPELSATTNGISMCRFGIAVNRNYANSDGVRETDFFNLTAWRGQADRCGKFLHKGNKVAIVGNLQNRSYEVNGEKRTVTDIIVEDVEFLTPKSDGGAFAGGNFDNSNNITVPTESNKVTQLEPVEDTDLPF